MPGLFLELLEVEIVHRDLNNVRRFYFCYVYRICVLSYEVVFVRPALLKASRDAWNGVEHRATYRDADPHQIERVVVVFSVVIHRSCKSKEYQISLHF